MTLAWLVWIAAQALRPLSGDIPRGLDVPSRVLFVPAEDSPVDAGCDAHAGRWICAKVAAGSRGLVVFVGQDALAWLVVGTDARGASAASWGRVVQVSPAAVTPAELHDLGLTPWKPDRPRLRSRTRQFMATADDGVRVTKLSSSRFWVSGRVAYPDAFLLLEGPAIGSQRLPTARLPDEPAEQIVYLDATLPATLQGYVQGSRGEDAQGAHIELMEVLDMSPDARVADDTPVIHRASTSVSADGSFRFERVTGGPFRISARHARLGRGVVWATAAGPPISIKLAPAPRVTGRVLRQKLPLAGARVRFVPDIAAWAVTADPIDVITAEATTGDDGVFVVGVPLSRSGTIQILTTDGGVVRVAVPEVRGELSVGDVAVPDRLPLLVRMIDEGGCDLVAAGPLGALGLVMVRGTRVADLHQLDLPEPGSWALTAECGGDLVPAEPAIVTVPADSQAPVDVRLIRPPDS